jgi:hypothetical protein
VVENKAKLVAGTKTLHHLDRPCRIKVSRRSIRGRSSLTWLSAPRQARIAVMPLIISGVSLMFWRTSRPAGYSRTWATWPTCGLIAMTVRSSRSATARSPERGQLYGHGAAGLAVIIDDRAVTYEEKAPASSCGGRRRPRGFRASVDRSRSDRIDPASPRGTSRPLRPGLAPALVRIYHVNVRSRLL